MAGKMEGVEFPEGKIGVKTFERAAARDERAAESRSAAGMRDGEQL